MGYDGRVVFEIDADTKSFDNQIEKVEEELNDLINRYEETQQMAPFKGKDEDLRNLGIEIEKTANKYKNLKQQAEKAAQSTKEVTEESEKVGFSIDKGFSKGLKSVKKLALGIIGIRSAYMLARRAASAYMAQDEELSNKMQQAWVGLGAFLEPLLSALTDMMMKFVGYLNVFITALTGTDYIANANAKALEKQAKAQANLNKEMQKYQQYDFDVIRTQQDYSSASSGYDTNEASNLFDMPELDEKIVKKLQDLAKWLRENKDLIEAVGIALGITFGAVAIGNLLANIGALIGSGTLLTGLAGLAAILGILATAWVIKVYIDGKKEVDDMWEKVNDMYSKGLIKQQDVHKSKLENPESDEAKNYANKIQGLPGLLDKIYKIQQFSASLTKSKKEHPILNALGWYKGDEQALENFKKNLKQHIEDLLDLADANLINEDGLRELAYVLNNYDDIVKIVNIDETRLRKAYEKSSIEIMRQKGELDDLTTEYEELLIAFKKEHPELDLNTEEAKKEFEDFVVNTLGTLPKEMTTKLEVEDKEADKNITNWVSKLTGIPSLKTTTLKLDADTSNADNKLNELARKLAEKGLTGALKFFSSASGFATGGYVSQPTLAVVGEGRTRGEYMIPDGEDYISRLAAEIGQYSGGNGVTNVYLDGRLIQRQMNQTQQGINFTKNR